MKKKKEPKLEKFDPIDCNVPNVNFSLVSKDDKRWEQFKQQRLERGFDESETWSLDFTIASFIVPRLEEFISIYKQCIVDERGAVAKMESALEGFKLVKSGETIWGDEKREKIEKGLQDFADIFLGLWW